MDFPFEDCIIGENIFPAQQVRDQLPNKDVINFIVIDLAKLREVIDKSGEKKLFLRSLSLNEQAHWDRFTSEKRKLEWLGGRFAAKYIIAKTLINAAPGNTDLHWPDLEIMPDENGRPFLSVNNEGAYYPHSLDISISHSQTMAAAMTVRRGRCGIDIEKITSRTAKVRDRFCTPGENNILHSTFPLPSDETPALTKLWAAKESLRKVSGLPSLPGFLELELVKISAYQSTSGQGESWQFAFRWENKIHEVALALVENYALAMTITDDTVD